MTITVSYPENINKQKYILDSALFFHKIYEEFESTQLESLISEVVTKVVNVIDNESEDHLKIQKIHNLKSLITEVADRQKLTDALSQTSISDASSSESSSEDRRRPATGFEVIELCLRGEESILEVFLRNKKIALGDGQVMARLQLFIADMTKKCINDICDATLLYNKIDDKKSCPGTSVQEAELGCNAKINSLN